MEESGLDRPIRVMLVDDHVFWRHGLRQIIDAESDMQVVGEAGDGAEAQSKAAAAQPDVILMDVNMPKVNGVEATRSIAVELPEARIVMLTVSDTDENLFESIKAGALGFLTKDISRPNPGRSPALAAPRLRACATTAWNGDRSPVRRS